MLDTAYQRGNQSCAYIYMNMKVDRRPWQSLAPHYSYRDTDRGLRPHAPATSIDHDGIIA